MSIDGMEVRSWHSASAASVGMDEKTIQSGTHRVCPPEVTLARVLPLLPQMGITRVAEVTQLDELGIPVFQAIRPNSRNLSVSQGKGVTKALAKVSAIMESIETWHAEKPILPSTYATVGDMATHLPYSVYDLNLAEYSLIHDAFELEWFPAHVLGSWEQTYVPAGYVRLDLTVTHAWVAPTFDLSSNGLASGNTLEEAILHGLYEVIERDTFAQVKLQRLQEIVINPLTIDGEASAPLIEQLYKAGADFELVNVTGPTGVPCFEARIVSPNYPMVSMGYGCHLDRDVSLCRAITEAAQSRLTLISGSRDDIPKRAYERISNRRAAVKMDKSKARADFHDVPTCHHARMTEDLQEVTNRLQSIVSCPPVVVNLTHPELNIPVVFVAAPQLRFWETHK